MQPYIACYDISCSRLRKRALTELLDISHSRQYSVFECNLTELQAQTLKDKLSSLLEPGDSFMLFKARSSPAIRLGAVYVDLLDIGYLG
ncbi:CRISPR-associated endonuclease Cas2 [Oceanisphaera profunda]|uniref:CRISPR-associated endoribonuclease Cas2 n=1 Tax=Oceanisphaera profunda TaxID=1416627 RepID=A0A1Y0D7E2_9GAMM|nr:CRISPR-associated endonuclease Cas2 [Oceanisphaera profunda]ART83440.1 CRISPR-associated endonuclease Cas2 [Oceanisphaera profunda]